MNKWIIIAVFVFCFTCSLKGQDKEKDTAEATKRDEVVFAAGRIPFLFSKNPGAASLVDSQALITMPRSAAADEALRLVPGVSIDNRAKRFTRSTTRFADREFLQNGDCGG